MQGQFAVRVQSKLLSASIEYLNKARAGHSPAHALFPEIDPVRIVSMCICVFVCVRVCVCVCPRGY